MSDPQQQAQRALRNALGAFPTGVTVITARDDTRDSLVGLTVNSFSSVSLDPALVLWSLSCKSPNLSVFVPGRAHVIHVLADTQKDMAYQFASPGADKYVGVDYQLTEAFPAPVIEACTARFFCEVHQVLDGGDHHIILARVLRYDASDLAPLLFAKGQMMSLDTCTAP